MQEEQIICPKCFSNQISSGQKGFNNAAGALGMLSSGAMAGMAYGSLGSGQTVITCLKCGNKFKPGEGAIKTIGDDGQSQIVYQEIKKSNTGKVIALTGIFILIIIFIAIASFFSSLHPNN